MRDIGLRPYGMLSLSYMGAAGAAASGLNPFIFNLGDSIFTPAMAKRTSPGPFETAPIYQGDWDGSGVPDVVTFPRGAQLGNPTYFVYSNIDPYQGTVMFWITPEWDGDDGLNHTVYDTGSFDDVVIRKSTLNNLQVLLGGNNVNADISTWTAGTIYFVVVRWDGKNTLDGTNYICISINDVHSFGGTNTPVVDAPAALLNVGSLNGLSGAADAIIEGLTIYRRVLYDGTYGVDDKGGLDELNAIYAAGVGIDPTTITGSNDVVACQPTDSTAGAYATGTGEMWSHPLSSSIVDDTLVDRGKMPGGPWAIGFDGAATVVTVTDNATIQDLHDAEMTFGAWVLAESLGESNLGFIVTKGTGVAGEGWLVRHSATGQIVVEIECATTNARSVTSTTLLPGDGKWHYVVFHWDDANVGAARVISVAVDGIWETSYSSQTAGVGAITTDVGDDLYFGNISTASRTWDGAIAWVEISDNDRHTAGTNFENALPITPYDDVNTIESWDMDDGSGGTAAANINSPANDGTITSGVWENIWDREGTPVEPQCVEYDGTATSCVITDAARIQDLHDGAFCAEQWVCANGWGGGFGGRLFDKIGAGSKGWFGSMNPIDVLDCRVYAATTIARSTTPAGNFRPDNIFHHIAMQYDDTGDRKIYIWIDGIPVSSYGLQQNAVGLVVTDVGTDLYMGNRAASNTDFDGLLGGWARISSVARYTNGEAFVPDDMLNPPGVDANTAWQTNFPDGTGATLTDASAGANDGTLSDHEWIDTVDMSLIEPGAQNYHGGMVIGSDAADDGVVIGTAPTNPSDSVMLPRISYGQSGRAWPIVDFAGTEFKLPRLHDTHDGAGNSAALINSDLNGTQQLVGWTLYNITDGSSTTVTAISGDGTTATGVLAGGTDNDWDAGDEYIFRPPNGDTYAQHPIGTYGIWVLRTASAAVDLKVKNEAGEGVIQIHMMEVQESLLDGGDMEAGAGNPWIPTGWTNLNLDAGDTAAEAAIVHSGVQSIAWDPLAISGQAMYDTAIANEGEFIAAGGWFYGEANEEMELTSLATDRALLQYSLADIALVSDNTVAWQHIGGIWRRTTNPFRVFMSSNGAAAVGNRYSDDVYAYKMDDITITVTPANQANSLEGTGIRVDGLDRLVQIPIVGQLTAMLGMILWAWVPRHDDSTARDFGNTTPRIMYLEGAGADYIEVYWSAANTITLRFSVGAAVSSGNWATGGTGFTVGAAHHMRILYWPTGMTLYIDTVARITVAAAISFVNIPNLANWGHDGADVSQVDAVFQAP